jgi:hypothetical protein
MVHDIKAWDGNITVMLPYVYAVGPVNNRVTRSANDSFTNSKEVWIFTVYTAAGLINVFFHDNQIDALLERARLVEALNNVKPMQDAVNFMEAVNNKINLEEKKDQ